MTICAIHQPNFFPWAGYFDKIRQVDVFIFLDEVAYPKSGSGSGSYCNRVMLLNGGEPMWYGLPVKRAHGTQLIKNVCFANKDHSIKKITKSLRLNYNRSPNYQELFPFIEVLLNYPSDNLADYNINAIISLSHYFGFKPKFIKQSELIHHSHSTNLLIELVKQVGADTYLCGNGSGSYQEDHLFKSEGLSLIYQGINPTNYFAPKLTKKEAGLSILHHLMAHDVPSHRGKLPRISSLSQGNSIQHLGDM